MAEIKGWFHKLKGSKGKKVKDRVPRRKVTYNDSRLITLQDNFVKALDSDKCFENIFIDSSYFCFSLAKWYEEGQLEGYVLKKDMGFNNVIYPTVVDFKRFVMSDAYGEVYLSGIMIYDFEVIGSSVALTETKNSITVSSLFDRNYYLLNRFCPRWNGLYDWSQPKKDIALGNCCKKFEALLIEDYPDYEVILMHIHFVIKNTPIIELYGGVFDIGIVQLKTIPLGDKRYGALFKRFLKLLDRYSSPVIDTYVLLDDYHTGGTISSKVLQRVDGDNLVLTIF